jgi:hypothetical protein
MKMRKTAAVLASLVAAGLLAAGAAMAAEKAIAPAPAPQPALERKVVVYYFYNRIRCVSCRNIEQYTGETLGAFFAPQLKSGVVEWRPVNIDEKGNAHYADDYKLYSKSVILSEVVGGKEKSWKNLPRVWELLGSKEEFQSYVQVELQNLLDGKAGRP